jgi:hypothetical protein
MSFIASIAIEKRAPAKLSLLMPATAREPWDFLKIVRSFDAQKPSSAK